jgi:hypothetical protein
LGYRDVYYASGFTCDSADVEPKGAEDGGRKVKENQTGVENKHLKRYQVKEAFMDYKLYLFFLLGVVGNIPNGGISNFGTIIIRGFGFSTLVTTLMQVSKGNKPQG